MKILIALLFSILALCFTVRADTLQFTLSNSLTDRTVSFQLQQGQPPNQLDSCGCSSSIDHGYYAGDYFNVPYTLNGEPDGTTTVSLHNINYSLGPGIDDFLGNIFTGTLESPHFDLGTFTSLVECGGIQMLTCGLQGSGITLKISDTPEPSSLAMLLMGIPVLWFASRKFTAKQSSR